MRLNCRFLFEILKNIIWDITINGAISFYLDFQNYLRTQVGNNTTVNIIISTVDYLLRLQESISDFYWYYSGKETIDAPVSSEVKQIWLLNYYHYWPPGWSLQLCYSCLCFYWSTLLPLFYIRYLPNAFYSYTGGGGIFAPYLTPKP